MVQVANLFIYNPTLGNEFTEGEKILAFYPDIDFNQQKFHVGLCEGLMAFAGGFTALLKMDYIQTEKYHIGIHSPEDNFFIIIMISTDDGHNDDFDCPDFDNQSPRLLLQHILRHFYTTFTLLNSSFVTIQIRESLTGLRDRLTLFLAHYIPLIPTLVSSNFENNCDTTTTVLQAAQGLNYATMDKLIFLTIRYFISSLSINFPHTDTLALFHQNQLIYTQLSPEQTVSLQFVLSHQSMLDYLGLNAHLCTRNMSDEPIKKKLTQQEAELIPSKCVPIEMITNPSLYYPHDDDDDDDNSFNDYNNDNGLYGDEDDEDDENGDGIMHNGNNQDENNSLLLSSSNNTAKSKQFTLPPTTTNQHHTHTHNCGLGPYLSAHCHHVPRQCRGEISGFTTNITTDPLNDPNHTILSPPIFYNLIKSSTPSIHEPGFDLETYQFEHHKKVLKDILLYLQSGESSFTYYKRKAQEEAERDKQNKANMLALQAKTLEANTHTPRYQPHLLILQFGETKVVLSVTSTVSCHNGDDGCANDNIDSEDSKQCPHKNKECKCPPGTHPNGIGWHLEMPPPPPPEKEEDHFNDDNQNCDEDEDHDDDGENNDGANIQNPPEPEEPPPQAPPLPPLSYNPFFGTTKLYKHYYTQLSQFVQVNVLKVIDLIFPNTTNDNNKTSHSTPTLTKTNHTYDHNLPPHLYHNKYNSATKTTLNPALFPEFSTIVDHIHHFRQEITVTSVTNYIHSRSLDNPSKITSNYSPTISLLYPETTRASVLLPLGQQYLSPPQYYPKKTLPTTPLTQTTNNNKNDNKNSSTPTPIVANPETQTATMAPDEILSLDTQNDYINHRINRRTASRTNYSFETSELASLVNNAPHFLLDNNGTSSTTTSNNNDIDDKPTTRIVIQNQQQTTTSTSSLLNHQYSNEDYYSQSDAIMSLLDYRNYANVTHIQHQTKQFTENPNLTTHNSSSLLTSLDEYTPQVGQIYADNHQLNMDLVLNPNHIIKNHPAPPMQPSLYFDHYHTPPSHQFFSSSIPSTFIPQRMTPTTIIPHYSCLTSLHSLPICPQNYLNNHFVYDLSQLTPEMIDTINNPDAIRGLILAYIYGKRCTVMSLLKHYQLQKIQLLASPTSNQHNSFTPTSQRNTPRSDDNQYDTSDEMIDTNELDVSQFYSPDELKLDWSWIFPQNHPTSLLSIIASQSTALTMSNAQHTQRELFISNARVDNGPNGMTLAPLINPNGTSSIIPGNNVGLPPGFNALPNNIAVPSNYILQDMYNIVNVVDLSNELLKMQKGLFKHLFSF